MKIMQPVILHAANSSRKPFSDNTIMFEFSFSTTSSVLSRMPRDPISVTKAHVLRPRASFQSKNPQHCHSSHRYNDRRQNGSPSGFRQKSRHRNATILQNPSPGGLVRFASALLHQRILQQTSKQISLLLLQSMVINDAGGGLTPRRSQHAALNCERCSPRTCHQFQTKPTSPTPPPPSSLCLRLIFLCYPLFGDTHSLPFLLSGLQSSFPVAVLLIPL